MTTFERVRCIVAEELGKSEAEITPQSSLSSDLAADSLDTVELMMAFEEAFGVEFGDDSLSLITIQDIVDYIEARQASLAA